MKTALFAIFLCLSSISGAEIPKLFRERSFVATDLAAAVNHYLALGEEAAVRELSALAPDHDFKRDIVAKGFSLPERVGWVCRILFQPKGDKPLRGPGYGGHSLPRLTMPSNSWPLYPVAASGDSFFVLSEGYTLAGAAEDPKQFLAYCRAEGAFRKKPVPVPTRDQARKDVAMLHESAAWKAIKWKDGGRGSTYTMSEDVIWLFIQVQADGSSDCSRNAARNEPANAPVVERARQ